MSRFIPRSKWVISSALFVALILLGGTWFAKNQILAWYHVQRLLRANEGDREACAICVADTDQAAISPMLGALRGSDFTQCDNMVAALDQLGSRWPGDDVRRTELVQRMADDFARMTPSGQECTLKECAKWAERDSNIASTK